MRDFLRRKVVRIPSLIVSIFSALLAFLKWETAYASIPGDVSWQITSLLNLLGSGWLPVVGLFLFSLLLFGLWLGPDRLEAWIRWTSTQQARQSERAPTAEQSERPHPTENKQRKTQNKQSRKWLKPKSSRGRTRKQQMSVDLNLKESNNRFAVKVLLTEAEKEGRELCENDPGLEEAQQWVTYTYNLMDAALIGAARHFLNDEGLQPPTIILATRNAGFSNASEDLLR